MELPENGRLRNDRETSQSQCNHTPDGVDGQRGGEAEGQQIDVSVAIDNAGCGLGTLLYTIGPFIFCAGYGANIIIMGIINPIVRCEWSVSVFYMSLLNCINFITYMVFSFLTAPWGDRYGRKPIALVGAIGMTLSGVACVLTPNYWYFFTMRAMIGIFQGIGGAPGPVLSAEISPTKYRALASSGHSLAYGVGVVVTSLIANFTLIEYGWRIFILTTALAFSPSILFLAIADESPRYCYHQGETIKAEQSLKKIYKLNCKTNYNFTLKPPEDPPTVADHDNPESFSVKRICDVIRNSDNLRNTFLLLIIGYTTYLSYPLFVFSVPRIINGGYCADKNATLEVKCTYELGSLVNIVVVNIAEPIGLIASLIALEKLGRIKVFSFLGIAAVVLIVPMYFCFHPYFLSALLFSAYPAVGTIALAPIVLTTELMPTSIRSTMTSLVIGSSELGAISGLFANDYVFQSGARVTFAIIQVMVVIFTVSVFMLKRETRGAYLA